MEPRNPITLFRNSFPQEEALRIGCLGDANTLLDKTKGTQIKNYEKADKRTRRPAKDPLNALLNYGYGMLYAEVESAALSAGLDPQLGVLHEEEYNRPAFVFDAIEQFRPWVDRLVAELAIEGEIGSDWFRKKDNGIWLRGKGKKNFIEAWYEMINTPAEYKGRNIKNKDLIQALMRTLAKSFLGDQNKNSG